MLVEIENFQAIAKARFEVDGFTALVGRSNIGKSAVVRALKCALTGAEGTDFVRHDPETCARILKGNKKCKCFSSVKIHFDENRTLLWKKGDGVNEYTTWDHGDTQEYSRVGKSPDLPPMLQGFEPIQLGSNPKELVQVSDQFTPIFLLNVTGTVVADLLSDVAKLDDINKAMKAVTRDRKKASSTRDVREKDTLEIEKSLKVYASLDNTAHKVSKVESLYGEVEEAQEKVEEAKGFIRRLVAGRDAMKALKAVLKHDLPRPEVLEERFTAHQDAVRWSRQYDGLTSEVETLASATRKALPKPNLGSTFQKFQEVSELHRRLSEKAPVVKKLKGVDSLKLPTLEFEEALDKLDSVASLLARCQDVKRVLTKFKGVGDLGVPTPPDVASKLEALRALDKFQERIVALRESIKGLEEKHQEAVTEEAEALKEFDDLGVCPTCTQKVGPGHGGDHV